MKSISFFSGLALLSLFVLLAIGGLAEVHAQDVTEKEDIQSTKHAIEVLDEFVSRMDKIIAITQMYKQQAIKTRQTLVEGKTSKGEYRLVGVGQDTGWLIEHPAQAIGKTYDKYKEWEKAVEEENKANERWLEKQKEAKEKQEQKYKKK